MKQIFAIFAKDARRFWPEILVSLAILIAMAVTYPINWQVQYGSTATMRGNWVFSAGLYGFAASCIVALVPISWWILISRLIHGERLIGDTQFWLTRPYEWPKFLAAKLLFLAIFLYAPFLLAQCAMLSEAGFHPLAYLPGLSYNLMMATGVLILPIAALATLTTNFGRMTLVVLGLILYIAAVAVAYTRLPLEVTQGMSGPLGDSLSFLFITCGCATVVLLQYTLRKARLAWFAIGVTAALMSALAFLNPDQYQIERYYPVPTAEAAPPVQLAYAPTGGSEPRANEAANNRSVEIVIPVQAFGVPNGTTAIPMGLMATFQAPTGASFRSSWQAISNERYLPGGADSPMRFVIPRAVYDQFKSTPVTLSLTVALDQARVAKTTVVSISENEFSVPDLGICTPEKTWLIQPLDITGIHCRSAMRQPQLTYVTAPWTQDCSAAQADRETVLGAVWIGSFSTDPADFSLTSVWANPLAFSNTWGDYHSGETQRPHQLCPGSPITFTRFERVARTQVVLTIPNFQLPEIVRYGVVIVQKQPVQPAAVPPTEHPSPSNTVKSP